MFPKQAWNLLYYLVYGKCCCHQNKRSLHDSHLPPNYSWNKLMCFESCWNYPALPTVYWETVHLSGEPEGRRRRKGAGTLTPWAKTPVISPKKNRWRKRKCKSNVKNDNVRVKAVCVSFRYMCPRFPKKSVTHIFSSRQWFRDHIKLHLLDIKANYPTFFFHQKPTSGAPVSSFLVLASLSLHFDVVSTCFSVQ